MNSALKNYILLVTLKFINYININKIKGLGLNVKTYLFRLGFRILGVKFYD